MNKPLLAHRFDRADDEWYVEPIACSRALFAAEKFDGGIWDPACGQGNILASAVSCGHSNTVGSDIVQRGSVSSKLFHTNDFFGCVDLWIPNIVSNPPFGRAILAEKFIRHAISLRPAKLAVFVDVRFLFGAGRAAGLFSEFSPARIWFITPRPSCPPGEYLRAGNKPGGGTADYCWLVWTPRAFSDVAPSDTIACWLRCAP